MKLMYSISAVVQMINMIYVQDSGPNLRHRIYTTISPHNEILGHSHYFSLSPYQEPSLCLRSVIVLKQLT